MHPEMMREMIRQRAAERQEEARKISLARSLRRHRRNEAPGTFVLPPIPDYVDGTFRTAEEAEGSVPAGHTAR